MLTRRRKLLVDLFQQIETVGEARQRIMPRHERGMCFGALALGDVFMSDDPSASLDRLLHHVDRAAVAGLMQLARHFSGSNGSGDVVAVALDVAHEQANIFAVTDEFKQAAPGFHDVAQ